MLLVVRLSLKQKLDEEGLFSAEHKKPIPSVIKRIGVITSREGAVIQDIKNVAWRRNPSVDIVLYNTKVQGDVAKAEAEALAQSQNQNDKLSFLGMELSKTTLLWVAGGTVLVTFLLVFARSK